MLVAWALDQNPKLASPTAIKSPKEASTIVGRSQVSHEVGRSVFEGFMIFACFLVVFKRFLRILSVPFTDVLRKTRRCVTRNILVLKEGKEDIESSSFGLGSYRFCFLVGFCPLSG